MATKQTTEQTEAIELLRSQLPEGTTVYTIVRKVSSSGMSRNISAFIVADGGIWDITYLLIRAGLFPRARGKNAEGVSVQGCGMNMGFHLVYSVAQVIHNDGYALNQRWL